MQYDFSRAIAEYDDMLLMNESDLKNWRLSRVASVSRYNDDSDMVAEIRMGAALAICRHVIEDFLHWTPEEAIIHFGPQVFKMYRLNRVLVTKKKEIERIPSYGVFRFDSVSHINYHYLLNLMYPGLIFTYNGRKSAFSYSKEALLTYKHIIASQYVAKKGGSTIDTRISKAIFDGISLQDEVDTMSEFIRFFVNDFCAEGIRPSGKGRAYDIYRFYSDNTRVNKLIADADLVQILRDRALSNYDLICDYAEAVIPEDNMFYRKVFSYIYASPIKVKS